MRKEIDKVIKKLNALSAFEIEEDLSESEYNELKDIFYEFSDEENRKKNDEKLKRIEINRLFSEGVKDIQGVTNAILALSYHHKISRYTILQAIRENIENNY